jgi:sugar transferase (PEP-CTERM system associated)
MFKLFREYISLKVLFLLVTENLLIWGVLLFALNLGSYTSLSFFQRGIEGQSLLLITFLIGLLCQFCMYYTDLYDLTLVCRRSELMVRLAQAIGVWCLLMAVASFFFPKDLLGHNILSLTAVLVLAGICLWREGIGQVGFLFKRFGERVLILGTGQIGIDLCRKILTRNDLNLEVAGFLAEEPGRVGERLVNPGIIGTLDNLVEIVRQEKINRIVVSLQDRRGRLPVEDLLKLRLQGIVVEDASTLYESVSGRVPVGCLRPSSLAFSEGFRKFRWQLFLKRCFDLVFTSLGIILSFPLMVLIAVCIKLDSEGPILFRQERVGQFERVFTLLKFRSMRVGSEPGLPCWATQGDARITRVGRLLRHFRLDEMPQFFNILRGDMSIVGPRPERPYFVEKLKESIQYYGERHLVKPGLTGWAQIKFHYSSSEDETREKLEYDFFYIKNFSTLFDLAIIFQTIKTVLSGEGAR